MEPYIRVLYTIGDDTGIILGLYRENGKYMASTI